VQPMNQTIRNWAALWRKAELKEYGESRIRIVHFPVAGLSSWFCCAPEQTLINKPS
jgi:hypothetical protein